MYRDHEKQKEANREHARKYRLRKKGMTATDVGTSGMTQSSAESISEKLEIIKNKKVNIVEHHLTCRCMMCEIKRK
jgi:hypothetical protein